MQLTRATIEKWAGPEVFEEALERVRHGAVMKAEVCGNTISGLFARNAAPPVKCSFTVKDDGTVESRCTCEKHMRYGLICTHVVALGISVLERLSDPVRQQRYIEEQRHAKRIEDAIASSFRRAPHGRKAGLLIELPRDFVAQFAAGKVTVRLIVMCGEPPKPFLPENLPADSVLSFSDDDDTVLDVLEDMAENGVRSTLELNRIDFLGLLDVCRGRTLFLAGGSIIEVAAAPARFSVRANLDQSSGDLKISPWVEIPGEGGDAGKIQPVFLAELEKSFAIAGGRLWPLKPTLPLPYHQLYAEAISIPRQGIPAFVTGELPGLSAKLPFSFDDAFSPDCLVTSPGTPRFKLLLSGTEESVTARLLAVYGDKEAVACSPEIPGEVMEPDPDDFYNWFVRDIHAERRALARLTAAGFLGEQGDALAPVSGRRKVLNIFGGLVPPLRRLGWAVEVSGRLGSYFDGAKMAIPVVKVSERDADRGQFEVTITFEDNARHTLPQPLIQQVINRGDSYLDIGGDCILVDRDAVESMRDVFNDCRGHAGKHPGSFQLPEVYAPYVDSSLATLDGIDVELPEPWRRQARSCNREEKLAPEPLGELEGTLRPYQKTGVYWMRFLEKNGFCGILADEMGLGKTLQTLTWLSLARCNEATRKAPALVIAPTSLVENWRREAEKFTPGRKCVVMQGAARHELWDEMGGADIVITSYALLRRDLEHYAGQDFSVAILDEAQHIKNRSTQNAIAAKQIRAPARLVLTGTPVENGVADIWSIMDFLMPGYLGEYEDFRERYEIPISSSGRGCEEAQAKLHRKLRPFLLRRLKKDVAKDLPDKIQKVSFSTMTPAQAKLYGALRAVFSEKIGALVAERGFEKCRMDILALLLRLRQASCHPALLPPEMLKDVPEDCHSGKLEQFLDILDEAMDGGHRMLVFSQFVGMLSILRRTLDEKGIPYCYLDGSTKNRLDECRKFNQTPSIPVFLISLKAGGTGLNLTGADMVVHFDPWWNPAVEDQATDRAHRIGQKRKVCSIKLIAEGTVEERVLEMQAKKRSVIDATVGAGDAAFMQSLTWKDIQDLLK